ncbi:pentapeptide repeat-containing protein [Fluviispira sanaruensis]|uniref:Uncharacterized protein n=1 Tax=Fluviispira sanaruensis TaxID=2493639 RepID=A0A4P2VID6_FLUSA|nr:pentapeptide repeat-containing protein [Fluviispira sanaruensis]BBH52863.1 hypothetical protein JCM31447_13060 [Fluviispira sanaruensis]
MFDLNSILDSVANGKMNVEKAKTLIEKNYVLKKQKKGISEEFHNAKEESQEGLKNAFEKLKKSVNIDEWIKISSNLVSQISENMPQIEKIQENLAHNLQPIGFSPNISGLESKLSVFRAFHAGTDCVIKNNLVVGSQWFGVNISENSEIKNNKFTAVQFSELSIQRSDFCTSQFSLARLSNVTMHEARLENNKFSRASISDVCVKESDFTENVIIKSDFSETTISGSRLSRMSFHAVDFQDCEIESCDIQGVDFENCKFKECIFSNLTIIMDEPLKVNGRNIVGRNFSDCKNAEEFLNLLDSTHNDSLI